MEAPTRPPVRRTLGALLVVLLCAAVLRAGLAAGVTGGQPDNGQHPYVGMLVGPGQSVPGCTGVLVAADNGGVAVLTAAHCLYAGGPRTGGGWMVQFADNYSSSATSYAGTWVVSDQYQPGSYAHDLAAIVLSTTPPIQPAVLAAPRLEDDQPDRSLTVVGTGKPNEGQRRVATENVTGRDASWIYLRPGDGNTCDGDSGAPDLVPGSSTVVALTDQGSCLQDQDLRVDTTEAHRFLVGALQSQGAPSVTGQPADATAADGATAQFTASAAGSSGTAVQWQRSTDGGVTFADVAGAASDTITVSATATAQGDQYRAAFSNSLGHDVTLAATLTVTTAAGTGTAGLYHALSPRRIVDTRTDQTPVTAGNDRLLTVLGAGGVPTGGVSAVVLAVVVASPPGPGDLEVYPAADKPANRTSNLNWVSGQTVANLVTTKVGRNGAVQLSVSGGSVDVAVDVAGWYGDDTGSTGARFTSLVPARVLDTGGATVAAPSDLKLRLRGAGGVPDRADVTAVALNLTVLGATKPADVEVYPGGAKPAVRTSNTNLVPGQTVAVAVNATLGGDGTVAFSVSQGAARVIVDVAGYYSSSGDRFVAVTPSRVVDRTVVTAGSDPTLTMAGSGGVPSDASTVVVNATGLGATHDVDLEVYPAGQQPGQRTSVLNLAQGQGATPNQVTSRLSGGSLAVSGSAGSTQLILDVLGYFTAA